MRSTIIVPLLPLSNQIHQVFSIFIGVHQSPIIPSLEQSSHTKRSQSIQLKFPFPFQMTTNEINYQRTNTCKYTFSHNHQPSSNILRHISTPSLELFHNHNSTNSLALTRSSFGRNLVRKKQPRTNPNYMNIQIKTDNGSLRSTYIRIDGVQKCPTLTLSSSSTPSSPSSSEQHSILCNSQTRLNESNGYFPSDETISTDKSTNETMINKKSTSDNDENEVNHSSTPSPTPARPAAPGCA